MWVCREHWTNMKYWFPTRDLYLNVIYYRHVPSKHVGYTIFRPLGMQFLIFSSAAAGMSSTLPADRYSGPAESN